MKIRFLKPVAVDIIRCDQMEDKGFQRWDELTVKEILILDRKTADIITEADVTLLSVPVDSFEVLERNPGTQKINH